MEKQSHSSCLLKCHGVHLVRFLFVVVFICLFEFLFLVFCLVVCLFVFDKLHNKCAYITCIIVIIAL